MDSIPYPPTSVPFVAEQQAHSASMNGKSNGKSTPIENTVQAAIETDDIASVFTLAPQLAKLPIADYLRYKNILKEHFKRRLSVSDLNKVVSDTRKAQKWTALQSKTNMERGDGKAIIEVNRQLRDVIDDCLDALACANEDDPTIFVQSGKLVTIHFDEDNGTSLVFLTESMLCYRLTQIADFVKTRATADDVKAIPVDPPIRAIQAILNGVNPVAYPFPALKGITELPIIRTDGSLHMEPGYDKQTKYVYIPGNLIIPPMPDIPTEDDIRQAKALLDEMLYDFPFVDTASKATIIADLITVVIRTFLNSVSPLTLLDAPKQGTGKTLLALIIGLIASGKLPVPEGPASDDIEWRKRIVTWLLPSPAVVLIDNIFHKLESGALSAVITNTTYGDRLLATQERITVTNNAVWFASGNNIQVGDDFARRCIKCRLDAKMSRPQERSGFHIEGGVDGLLEWVLSNRAHIVHAILTLVKHWFVQGCPSPHNITPLGNFEKWSRVVGGILEAAHIDGFLGNLKDPDGNNSVDDVIAEWTAFIETVHTQYQEKPFTCAALAKSMIAQGDDAENLRDLIPSSLTKNFDSYRRGEGSDMNFPSHIGYAFRAHKGQVFDSPTHGPLCLEISPVKASGNKVQWKITKLNSDSPDTASTEETPEPIQETSIDTGIEQLMNCPSCKRLNTFQLSTDKAHRTCTECFYHTPIVAQSWRDTPPEPVQKTPGPERTPNDELKQQVDEESIPEKYLIAMQQARASLAHLPVDFPALEIGDGKKKPKEQLNPQQALNYLSDLVGKKDEKWRDLALRTIEKKLRIWHAAAQEKEASK